MIALIRTKKKELGRNILEKLDLDPSSDIESIANENDLIEFKSGEVKNIGGSFTGVGKSSAMTGTLLSMEIGDISKVIETFNTACIIKMIDKLEIDQNDFNSSYEEIKSQLTSRKTASGYSNWLNDMKASIDIEDFRSKSY